MRIAEVQADHFRIPLTTVLSDSTHGEMSHFELVTVRVRSDSGEEGLGYTYRSRRSNCSGPPRTWCGIGLAGFGIMPFVKCQTKIP